MKPTIRFLSLAIPLLLFAGLLCGQGTPNCQYTLSFTAAGSQSPAFSNLPTTTGGGQGCVAWRVVYWTNTSSATSIQIEGAADAVSGGVHGPTGSYTVLTPAAGGGSGSGATTNPATATVSGQINACCDYWPWIRITVNTLTSSGAGTLLTVQVLGFKGTSAGAGSGGGSGKPTTLYDSNGLPTVTSGATPGAVDYLTVTNAATGSPIVDLTANGTDVNVGLQVAGKSGSANGQLGGVQIIGGSETGAGGSSSSAGGVQIDGGANASTSGASQAGSVELEGGASSNGGEQGLLVIGQNYNHGLGTVTQWNMECLATNALMTVNDCGASPGSSVGVTDYHSGAIVEVHLPGSISPGNSSNTAALGDTVCVGAASPLITDSGSAAPCTSGQGFTAGVVIAVSGEWNFADGNSASISTSLPLVQWYKTHQEGGGDIAGGLTHSFGASFDGSGIALAAGKTVYTTVPFACSISAWNIAVDTGTATIDIWKIATGTAIPTVSNSITASAVPAISVGTAIHSTTLTGWTTAVAKNDIVGINLKVVSGPTFANLVVECDQ